jgi:hypothetical protein
MSQVSPGWYPDPSGRFAQRYHDGTRWTEHVADAEGNRATDAPGGPAGSASRAGSAQPYGQGGERASGSYGGRATRSDRGYGGQPASDRGYGQESWGSARGHGQGMPQEQGYGQAPPGSSWGRGGQPSETSWGQGAGAGSRRPDGGGPVGGQQRPHARGGGHGAGQGWPDAPSGGRETRPDRRTRGPGPAATSFDAGWPHRQETAHGQTDYARAPAASGWFAPTAGLIVAVVGALILLLSLFRLDFLELSFPGLTRSVSLGDIAGDFGEGAPGALATYADFGRYLAVLLIVFAVVAVTELVRQLRDIAALPIAVAALSGGFALWHVLAMMASGEAGVDVSPTFGAVLGLLGYVGLAAAPFLRQPVGARR